MMNFQALFKSNLAYQIKTPCLLKAGGFSIATRFIYRSLALLHHRHSAGHSAGHSAAAFVLLRQVGNYSFSGQEEG
jgi:hypothetical protein